MKNVLLSLLAALSLSSIACANGAHGSDLTTSEEANDEVVAADKAPEFAETYGTKSPHLAITGATETASTSSLILSIPSLKASYEIADFEFSLESNIAASGAVKGGFAAKPQFSDLNVHVLAHAGIASLARRAFTGTSLDEMVIQRVAGKDTVDVARFKQLVITKLDTQLSEGSSDDNYSFHFNVVTISQPGGGSVTLDNAMGRASLDKVSCSYGTYIQADASWPLPKDTTRIDAAEVVVAHVVAETVKGTTPSVTGASLEALNIELPLERTGVCAAYAIFDAKPVASKITIESAPYFDPTAKAPIVSQSFDACQPVVKGVSFRGSDGLLDARIDFDASGVVRHDAAATSGWDFVANKEISACPAR